MKKRTTRFSIPVTVQLIAAIALCLLILPATSLAQKKTSPRKERKAATRQQIAQLHQGALLVRLQTKSNSIAALRRIGKVSAADKIEANQLELNKEIVQAFSANLDFCPTYFFFSDQSEKVYNKQLEEIVFLDKNLQPDSTIQLKTTNFLTAEFGQVTQDTLKKFDTYYDTEGKNGPTKEARYQGSSSMGFGALVIKSEQFVQLRKPFPFYVKTYDSVSPFKRPSSTTVALMNTKLHKYYKKAQKRNR